MVKCKLVLDESVLSTLHKCGEGQNVYGMFFSNPCDQGCLRGEVMSTLNCLTNHSDIWPQAKHEIGVKWRSCDQRWRQDDVSKFHGAALMRHMKICWLFEINNSCLKRNFCQNTTSTYCSLFPTQKPTSSTNLRWFIDVLQPCVTVY